MTTLPETGASARSVRPWRKGRRRFDYYPSTEALAAIDRLRESDPTFTTQEVLDILIEEGDRALHPGIAGEREISGSNCDAKAGGP